MSDAPSKAALRMRKAREEFEAAIAHNCTIGELRRLRRIGPRRDVGPMTETAIPAPTGFRAWDCPHMMRD